MKYTLQLNTRLEYSSVVCVCDDVLLLIQQAALLLHKGHDNEKITSSMATRTSELAYGIVHHPAYVWFNLFTALALLLLAVGEHPAMVWIYKEEREPVVSILTRSVLSACCIIHYYQALGRLLINCGITQSDQPKYYMCFKFSIYSILSF